MHATLEEGQVLIYGNRRGVSGAKQKMALVHSLLFPFILITQMNRFFQPGAYLFGTKHTPLVRSCKEVLYAEANIRKRWTSSMTVKEAIT